MSKPKKSSKKKTKKQPKGPTYRIPADSPWANAWKVAAAFGGLGLLACGFGLTSDPERFAYSWLFAFMCFLAVGLGSLFFVLGQHLTGSGWGVSLRRTSEFLLSGLPVFLVLFVPILIFGEQLYPWMQHHGGEEHGEEHEESHEEGEAHEEAGDEHGSWMQLGDGTAHAQDARDPWDVHPDEWDDLGEAEGHEGDGAADDSAHHDPEHQLHGEILESKTWWLNKGFFYLRAGIYFIVWLALFWFYFSGSTRQDKEKGLALTKRMELFAPASTILFGLTLTGAALDWTMSMEPSWYSTIFGVQYFAVSCVIAHAVIILITMGLRKAGHLGDAIHVEHFHDIGKLLHGFIVFWAYISFSQFMLIWYAGIPEEATYFHLRWWGGGGFLNLSVIMIIAGFIIPFFILMSRNAKRNLPILTFGAAWVAVMHVVQCYWLYMPYAEQTGLVETTLRIHWLDIAALLAVGGTYLAVVFWNMTRFPLIPVGDPRVQRAIHHEVV